MTPRRLPGSLVPWSLGPLPDRRADLLVEAFGFGGVFRQPPQVFDCHAHHLPNPADHPGREREASSLVQRGFRSQLGQHHEPMGGGPAFCLLLPLPGDIRLPVVIEHRSLLTRGAITVPHAPYGGDHGRHSGSVTYTTAREPSIVTAGEGRLDKGDQ